jgi:hypothetical protein
LGDDPENNVDLADTRWRPRIDQVRWVFLMGWRVRNYPLVAKHQHEIRRFFQPTAAVRDRIDSYLQAVRYPERPLVGVHIRQRDYRWFQGGKHYLEATEYANYMRRVERILDKRPRFVICSDEPQAMASFDGLDVRFGPGHLIEDLYVLAGCDFVLGVPSTFSRWAAFYGQTRLYIIDGVSADKVKLEEFEKYGDCI